MINALTSAGAALGGAYLFQRLNIPSGVMLGAMVGVAIHNLVGHQVPQLPGWLSFLAYTGLGWAIGQTVTKSALAQLRTSAVPILVIVVGLLVAGGLLAVVLARVGGLGSTTAFLASSPGALSQMAVLSRETGSDTLLVVTVHTLRVIAVLMTAPLVARYLGP